MKYQLFYFIYLFSSVFLTAELFSLPITPRQLFAIIMFIVCLFEEKKLYFSKYWGLYLVFILFYWISSLVTGYDLPFYFRLFGDFFVAYVACWATKINVEKHNGGKPVLVSLMILGVINAIITIGQVYNWPFVTIIAQSLNLNIYASYYEALEYGLDMTMTVFPGLFRSGVMNGHFLMSVAICSMVMFTYDKKVFGYIILVIILTASYLTQQRAGFFIATAFTVFLLYRTQKAKQSSNKIFVYIAITIVLVIAVFVVWKNIGTEESRYTENGLSLTGREILYATAADFYLENPILGGFQKFINEYHMYPHNFFLNALITGGLFGGSAIIIMVFMQIVYIIKGVMRYKNDITSWILGLVFFAAFLDSLVHNISLCTGDILAWIAWTAFWGNIKTKDNNINMYSSKI